MVEIERVEEVVLDEEILVVDFDEGISLDSETNEVMHQI